MPALAYLVKQKNFMMFQLIRQLLILEIMVCDIKLKGKSQDKPSIALVNIDA